MIPQWPWQYLLYTLGATLLITLYEAFASTKSFVHVLNAAYSRYFVLNLVIYETSVVVLRLTFFSNVAPIPTVFSGLLMARGIFQQLLEDLAEGVGADPDHVRNLRKTLLGETVEATSRRKALAEDRAKNRLVSKLARLCEGDEHEGWLKNLAVDAIPDKAAREEFKKDLEQTKIPLDQKAHFRYLLARIVVFADPKQASALCSKQKEELRYLKRTRKQQEKKKTGN